ncbi:MAG: hypothetical protein ACRDYA_01455 [Egibacteraceae bacterium]
MSKAELLRRYARERLTPLLDLYGDPCGSSSVLTTVRTTTAAE